jgi:hypothetical protein
MKTFLAYYLLSNFLVYGMEVSSVTTGMVNNTFKCEKTLTMPLDYFDGAAFGVALFMADNSHLTDDYCKTKLK